MNTNDLQLMLTVLEQCAKRGAFAADEFLAIGNLREKLIAELQPKAQPAQTAPKEPAPTSKKS